MAYTAAEIFMKMNSNCNTTQRLDAAQQASHRLEMVHRDMSNSLTMGQYKLATFWKGEGADATSGGLNPLIKTSTETADRLKSVRESMYEQNSAFHETRGSLRPVSTERPDDSGLLDYASIGASDAEKAAAEWDNNSRHNIAQYDAYARITEANRPRVAVEYTPVDAKPASGSIATSQSDSVTQAASAGPSVGTGSGYHGPTSPSGYSGGTGTPLAPSPQVHSPAPTPSPPQTQVPPAAQWQPPGSGTTPSRVPVAPPGGVRRPGYMPPPPSGYDTNPRNPGFGPHGGGFGPVGTGGGAGSTGGFGPRGSGGGYGGSARGFGPVGGGVPGPGGQGAGQPGMGRGTGAVMPGENAAARGGAAGSSGAAGGRGAGMMGGPMGAGGRGKGSEDEEHQRKITLPGDDPDSLFGGTYERTTPPVIGEQKN